MKTEGSSGAAPFASAVTTRVGTVAGLWRYPVKSMLGEELEDAEFGDRGLAGDRGYALLDVSTGRVVSAKNPKRWPAMFRLRASYASPPARGRLPPVRIAFPDGEVVASDGAADARLSAFLGRPVRLVTGTSTRASVEVYSPPLEGLDVEEGMGEFRVPTGPFHDSTPVHVVTTATLTWLRTRYPGGRFEVGRFRPNVLVETAEGADGPAEQSWIGRTLEVGGVRIRVTRPCSRCVMTTLPQGDLPDDRGILRTVTADAGGDVGVKGTIEREGRVRRGDPVLLTGAKPL